MAIVQHESTSIGDSAERSEIEQAEWLSRQKMEATAKWRCLQAKEEGARGAAVAAAGCESARPSSAAAAAAATSASGTPFDSNLPPLTPFGVAMPPNAPRLPPSCMPPATKLSMRCNATKQQSAAWQRYLAASTSALPGVEKAPEETSTALQTPLRRELPLFLALRAQTM